MTKQGSTRITITMTDALLERVQKYADGVGITKGNAISVLCAQMLDSIALSRTLEEMNRRKTIEQMQEMQGEQISFDQAQV